MPHPPPTAEVSPSVWVEPADGEAHRSGGPNGAAYAALVWLLRATGHSGGGGRSARLYATIVYGLLTANTVFHLNRMLRSSAASLQHDRSVFSGAFVTVFIAAIEATMWLALTATYARGRRRFTDALLMARAVVLKRLETFAGHAEAVRRLRRAPALVLLVGVLLHTAVFVILSQAMGIWSCSGAKSCAKISLITLSYTILDDCFWLIQLKFVFAAYHIDCGIKVVNAELEAQACRAGLLNVNHLRHLRQLYIDLTDAFRHLTDAMQLELLIGMFYGITMSVYAFMLTSTSIQTGLLLHNLTLIIWCILSAARTVLAPCEVNQRVLTRAGRTRDLLLQLECLTPDQCARLELDLFDKLVARDLATLGHLGLCRPLRSTVTVIVSTVLTYVIVLVQFYVADLAGGRLAADGT